MQTFNLYHLGREYARSLGDPLLGSVTAASEEDAVRAGNGMFWAPTGTLAIPADLDFPQEPLSGADYDPMDAESFPVDLPEDLSRVL